METFVKNSRQKGRYCRVLQIHSTVANTTYLVKCVRHLLHVLFFRVEG